ncbi:MAG: hypothetical protein HY735_14880 [Verrucomicrobia bacterium]|nr:hypothetical protein [Verrucomicrobiota bacterium]
MKFYAHTATLPDGSPDRDPSRWQPLSAHLRNVAERAREFAAPLCLAAEAELEVGECAPARCEICAPVQFHRYAFNCGGPHGGRPDGLNAGLSGFSSLV